ncbi:MAG: aminotransferase class III-fold pyridoxal phosphate-dependent enzyme, partial [Methylocella sp.]
MESRYKLLVFYALGAAVLAAALVKLKALLELSKAQQWSLTGHDWIARRIASLIPYFDYDE